MCALDLKTDFTQRHLKTTPTSLGGVFAGEESAGIYANKNGVVASNSGVGIAGATHIMATPESIRFSFLFVPNPAAIVPSVPAYIMAGPPVIGPAYLAYEMSVFAALTAASIGVSAAITAAV